jgi:succinate dehydrogenase / fumarate reductase cytochrome b subunit
MDQRTRPLSPHLQIYRWQVQMVTSILHRATGIALAIGTLLLLGGLLSLAAGRDVFDGYRAFLANPLLQLLLVGWTWAFAYHLCNGVRHLLQDAGLGFAKPVFVRNGWIVVALSLLITLAVWAYLLGVGGAA